MNLRVIFEPFYKHSTLLHQEVLISDGYPEFKMLFYIPMIVFNFVTDFLCVNITPPIIYLAQHKVDGILVP